MARNAASIRASMGVLVLTGCDRDASANSLYEATPWLSLAPRGEVLTRHYSG